MAILLIVLTSCKAGNQPAASQAAKPPYGDEFREALDRARAASASDELSSQLQRASTIPLRGTELGSAVVTRYHENGFFAVIDGQRGEVKLFSQDGNYRCTFGSRGNAPGEYLAPSDVIPDGNGFTLVDFTMRRVSHFDTNCKFELSFIYSPQGFAATRVLRTADGGYVLFGNRWLHGHAVLDLIHRYTEKGEFIGSSVEFPDMPDALNLAADDQPAVASGVDGNPYFQLPFSTVLYEIARNGEVIPRALSLHLQLPNAPLVLKADRMQEYWKWRLSWTPVVSTVVDDKIIWVEYQSFSPLRYTLEQFDKPTGRHLMTIQTNHLLLSRGPNGSLLFLDQLDNRGESDYAIDEFKTATPH